jgi:FkbM family methyltransferase
MLGALFYPVGTKDNPIKFDSLFIPYIYKEIYFDGVYADIFNTKTDMVVIDVGANIGVVTQYMRNFCSKLYAIEPSSEHYEALKKNKEFNEWDNVDLFNMAIAGKDGEVTMHKLSQNRTCNSYTNDYGQEKETVKAQTFETFFKENNIDSVDFVKFDVEGAEDDILRSDGFKNVAHKIKAIEIEFHHPTWRDLVAYMESLGFIARRYDSSAIILLFTRK